MRKINTILLASLLVLISCTKPVDFEKWDDTEVDATYIFTLIYLDLSATSFLDESNMEMNFISDVLEIPISDDLEPYIEKIEFTVITKNSFNRDFNLDFTLFDEDNNPIYTIRPTLQISANAGEQSFLLAIPASDISVIYQMTFIGAVINMVPDANGQILDGTETYEFELKSSMKIFVNY